MNEFRVVIWVTGIYIRVLYQGKKESIEGVEISILHTVVHRLLVLVLVAVVGVVLGLAC